VATPESFGLDNPETTPLSIPTNSRTAPNGECEDTFSGSLLCAPVSQCPSGLVSVDDPSADCKGGLRTVTGEIFVIPDPSKSIGITVLIDGKPVGVHGPSATNYSVPFIVTLGPGNHTLTYTFTDPTCTTGLPWLIKVRPCEGCPTITFKTAEGPCKDGKREVTVSAAIPDQGVVNDAKLLHGTNLLDQASQSGAITLTGKDLFPGGTNSVSVETSQPPECKPTSFSFPVTPCQDSRSGGDGGDGEIDDGGGGCILGRIAVVLLFATALFLTILGLCVPPPATAVLIAAAAAWVVAGIAFAIWYRFCGSPCGALLVLWQSFLIGMWLALFLWVCCPAAVIATLAFGAIAAGLFTTWVLKCKPTPCRIFVELAWVTAVPVATMFAVLDKIIPCGALSGVYTLEAAATAAFASAAAIACGAKKGS
jgi:hypothetical protein